MKRFGAPPLLGAELRVKRARQLIGTLQRQLKRWAHVHVGLITADMDETGKVTFDTLTDPVRIGRISITLGEIAYNLRAALDYMIADLAALGTGKVVSGTQFPIEDSPKIFRARITGKRADGKKVAQYLRGVPQGAIPLIEKLQPYAGCAWTKDLRDFSNPDKHRHLTGLGSRLQATVRDPEITLHPETGERTLGVYFDGEVEVFLADGRPVFETLQTLCREVEATVALFKSRIKSS